jgi:hypothetical protein
MGDRYKCKEMTFRMQTVADTSAKIAFKRASIPLRLLDLEYLLENLPVLANQLTRYRLAEYDVSDYV